MAMARLNVANQQALAGMQAGARTGTEFLALKASACK